MKKLFLMGVFALLFSSCTIHRSSVRSLTPEASLATVTSVASLEVEHKPITYTYVPTKHDGKNLSEKQLLDNAAYLALKDHGKGDVLVNINYYMSVKRSFGKRVRSIVISGYPAKYVDFRHPTEADYENLEFFNTPKSVEQVREGFFGRKKMHK